MTTTASDYPIRVEVQYPEHLSRLMIFVKWLLVIPHLIVLTVLGIAAALALIVSWFAVLITGRYPRGLFEFVAGVLRWGARAYAYMLLLTDRYPPFSLQDDPSYPVRVQFDYPEHLARWHPLLNWLLSIPAYLALYVLTLVMYVVALIAWFAILILGRLPRSMFDVISVWLAWQMRVSGYIYWMTGRYPPFVWG